MPKQPNESWIDRWLELLKFLHDIGMRVTSEQRDELRARLEIYTVECMVAHGVPFSLACKHKTCNAMADGFKTPTEAMAACWTFPEPADPADISTHFYGNCPEHSAAPADEDAAINKATIVDEFSDA